MKILIVDDDIDFLSMIDDFLIGFDFELAIASQFKDALKYAKAFKPDVAILDYLMRGDKGTGVNLARKLKIIDPTVKLILVTGTIIREHYEEDLFVKEFKKPLNLKRLKLSLDRFRRASA